VAQTVRLIAREMRIEIPADAVLHKTRRPDSNRIVQETVTALEGLAMGLQLVDPDALEAAQISDWTASLAASIRDLDRFVKTMKETAQ